MFMGFDRLASRPALVDGERTVTYAELHAMGEAFAAQIPERTLIFILCSNQPMSAAGKLIV